jgi:TRAP-type transport system periplasmic protein
MINRKTFAIVALMIASLSLDAIAQSKITLKIASVAPSRSPWDIEQRSLAQEWSQITNGLVTVQFYDATSLGGEKGVIQKFRSVRPGQKAPLDGVIFSTIGLNELAPKASIYTLSSPFLIRSQKELDIVLSAYGDSLTSEYRKQGFEILTWTNVGWLTFYTKDSFANLSELKKIKIASAGIDSPVLGNSFRAAGYTIEDITSEKLLQALQSAGGVRGFFGVPMYAYVTGLSKTVGHSLDARLCPVLAGLVLSTDSWAKIPAEYKPGMLEAIARMKARLDASLDKSDRDYVESMKKDGLRMINPTEAELAAWEADFNKDMAKISKAVPGAIDMELYSKIRETLSKARN